MEEIPPTSFYALRIPAADPAAPVIPLRPVTPPSTKPKLQSGATPITHFRDKSAPFTSLLEDRDARISAGQKEISGRVVGPVSGHDFLDFLPGRCEERTVDLNPMLNSLATATRETEMYGPWVEVMNELCPDLLFVDAHDEVLTVLDGVQVKPDVNVYPFKSGSRNRSDSIRKLKTIEMMIEFKLRPRDDPFEDEDAVNSPIEQRTDYAAATLGQIAVYATAHQAAQFRTHVFSALVFPTYIRLLRWDRSGVVVTKKLRLNSNHVVQFFHRFNDAHATPNLRGHDTTVAKANLADDVAARIREKLSCQPGSPLLAISIGQNQYIIAEPSGDSTEAVAPTGRSTRCFRAYCMRNKRIVLLKDTWRVLWPTLKPEHETYQTLHAKGVQNIPQCYDGEDVGGDNSYHRTQTKHWADRHNLNLTLREFQHYRTTLEYMDRILEDFEDVHQMVSAVRDASEAHRQAVVLANVLHRDISVGNIMMKMKDGEYKGFLIDWDLCLDLTQEGAAQSERTGTWQFTAIRLLEEHKDNRNLVAERVDDVESFLHVLTWMALRYTAHSLTPQRLSSTLRDNFDASFTTAGKRYITDTRSLSMTSGRILTRANFTNKGIMTILEELGEILGQRYADLDSKLPGTSKTRFALRRQISIQVRDEALEILQKDDAWLPNLLTQILESPTNWEVDNHRVVHTIVDPRRDQPIPSKRKSDSMSSSVPIKSSRRDNDTADVPREILEHGYDDL